MVIKNTDFENFEKIKVVDLTKEDVLNILNNKSITSGEVIKVLKKVVEKVF